jgi:phosphomannomutase
MSCRSYSRHYSFAEMTLLKLISQISAVIFGTSGARGLVSAMTADVCASYTQAFLNTVAADANEIVLGHDLRPSSPTIAAACAQAIRDAGKTVVFVGALPTPAVAYYAVTQKPCHDSHW